MDAKQYQGPTAVKNIMRMKTTQIEAIFSDTGPNQPFRVEKDPAAGGVIISQGEDQVCVSLFQWTQFLDWLEQQ